MNTQSAEPMDIERFLLLDHLMEGEFEPESSSNTGIDIEMLDLTSEHGMIPSNLNNDITPVKLKLPLKSFRKLNGKHIKGKLSKPFNFLRIIGMLKSNSSESHVKIAPPPPDARDLISSKLTASLTTQP